jgi:hypothetical protein
LAGRRVRCSECREVVTVPTASDITPREGVESILGDPEESEDSVIGTPEPLRKPILPPEPRDSRRVVVGRPVVTPPPVEDPGNPFAGLGDNPPRPGPASSRAHRSASRTGVPVWVWLVIAALAGYGALTTAIAVWGWLLR